MANVSSSNGLEKRPKLRFPGFDEPYKQCHIGDIYAERSQRGASDMELLSVTMNDGVMPRSEIEGKDNSSEDKSNYKVVLMGDMVYNSMRMWQGANGISPCDGIVSPAYTVLMPKTPISNGYFAALFKSPNLINEFRKNSQGMTSDTWNLKYPQIETIKVCIPALSEQNRVADMLGTLERRIAKQAQIVDNLKKYKRGVVTAILTHQIKFADDNGEAYPEWTPCTLQDAVNFLDGQRKPLESADRARRKGAYPYYGASGIIDYIDDYIFDEPLLLLGEDGANIINRSTPLCFIATGKYWVNNHAHVMRPKNGHNIKFLCELLESLDYTRYNTGTAQPKLNQEKCRGIELVLPIYEEQCRIADFLSSLDQKAEREQANLECLLLCKRGMMQQLFI
jgi:type I restriction enzyme S subunit